MLTVTVRPSGDTVGAPIVMPVDGVSVTLVAPARPCPVIVNVTGWPFRVTWAGNTLATDGPLLNDRTRTALDDCGGAFGGPSGAGLKNVSDALALEDCAGGLGGPSGAGLKKVSVARALADCSGGFGGPSGAGLKKVSVARALDDCSGGFGGPSGAALKKLKVATVLSVPGGSGPLSPTSATTCGLPAALLWMLSEAVRCPMTVGVNRTPMPQLAPAARVPVHVLLASEKFTAGLIVTVPNVTGSALLFVTGMVVAGPTVLTWRPPRLSDGVTDNVPAIPTPPRLTIVGLPTALLCSVSEPVRLPVAVGVKRTPIVQPAPTSRVSAHEFVVMLKSPLALTAVNVTGRLPVFCTVTL